MKCVAFDCFGTVFDMAAVPRAQIAYYVRHVRSNDFTPYQFPQSWYDLPAHRDAAEGLDMLRGMGLQCVTLSNGSVELLRTVSDRNGLHWDHYVDLVAHKVYKPHRNAYLTVEKDLGIPQYATLMVTANPDFGDIEGAESVGMPWWIIRRDGWPATIVELAEELGAETAQ